MCGGVRRVVEGCDGGSVVVCRGVQGCVGVQRGAEGCVKFCVRV